LGPLFPLFLVRVEQICQDDGGSGRVRTNKRVLAYYTVLLKTKVVHGLVNRFFDFLPVRSPLDEFVHVLEDISIRKFQHHCKLPQAGRIHHIAWRLVRSVQDP